MIVAGSQLPAQVCGDAASSGRLAAGAVHVRATQRSASRGEAAFSAVATLLSTHHSRSLASQGLSAGVGRMKLAPCKLQPRSFNLSLLLLHQPYFVPRLMFQIGGCDSALNETVNIELKNSSYVHVQAASVHLRVMYVS